MKPINSFTKILAVAGGILVWGSLLAPVLFSIGGWIARGVFHFDYLMPAELFPLVLAGGGLLVWAAWRGALRRQWIVWGLSVAAGALVGGQALAVFSGLAAGTTPPEGIVWGLVLASLGIYWLAVIAMGIGGVLLLRDLFSIP